MRNNKKAITILEMLVVVVIIAITGIVAAPQFIGAIENSRDSSEKAEINSVAKAASMYYAENGYYPTLQGDQPTLGDPKNLKFSADENGEGLYPNYLASLPHFSYWYIDYEGTTYHVNDSIEIALNSNLQPEGGVTPTGTPYKIPYKIKDNGDKVIYPIVIEGIFGGTKMNPEAPEYVDNKAPIAVISMTPNSNILTTTTIAWNYTNSTDPDGDAITNVEWEGKQDKYATAGSYTVRLRVQDGGGLWSEWTEKSFNVIVPPTVQEVYASYNHTIAIMTDGTLRASGNNSSGQLGDGTTISKNKFVIIPGVTNVIQVSAGRQFSIALMGDGTVKAWGDNIYGQLGDGTTLSKYIPTTIPGLTDVKQIVAKGNSAFAILNNGDVKAWGYNGSGQLGDGTTVNKLVPTTISGLSGVNQIKLGSNHALALLTNGTVKAWGGNDTYQLGDGTTVNRLVPKLISGLTNVKQLTAGCSYSLALLNDGTVKAWGSNNSGKLGFGNTTNKYIPTIVSGLSNVKQLEAGDLHTVALLTDGTVKSWGFNMCGQLGDGTTVTKSIPTEIPGLSGVKQISVATGFYTTAVMTNGIIKSWGNNVSGELGDGTTVKKLVPTTITIN